MGKKAAVVGWRNRIVRLEYHKPDDLLDHPKQWKRHGDRQLAALRAVLGEVGIAGALHAWRSERHGGRLTVWDGHGRKSLEAEQLWPVLVTDLNDEEADKLLLLFDPIGALAEIEPEKLRVLLEGVEPSDAAIGELLDELAREGGLEPAGGDGGTDPADSGGSYESQYGVIVICDDEAHQERVYTELEAAGHKCRVVVT